MCLILRKPPNCRVPWTIINDAWVHQHDGWGIIIRLPDNSRLIVKGYEFSILRDLLAKHEDKDILLHLRFATHGSINNDNTHPFDIFGDGQYWLMHNGILQEFTNGPAGKSDTANFCEFLKHKFGSSEAFQSRFQETPEECCPLQVLGDTNLIVVATPTEFRFFGDWCYIRGNRDVSQDQNTWLKLSNIKFLAVIPTETKNIFVEQANN